MKRFLLFIFLAFLFTSGFSQSKVIQSLKDNDKVQRGYYLYPSTLRMLNFQKDQEFNKLIRNIRKVSFLTMRTPDYNANQIGETVDQLQKKEGFEIYMELSDSDSELLVLGRDSPDELIGVSSKEGKCYIIDLLGTIDLLQLPKIYENLTQRDTSQTNGLSLLFDMVNEDADREKKQKERRKQWEEQQKKEKAQRDSIEQSKVILKEEKVNPEAQ